MADSQQHPCERIIGLLDHLGIGRAHVVACMSSDWGGLLQKHSDRLCSLTIVAPHLNKGMPGMRSTIPLHVISGSLGPAAERARQLAEKIGATKLTYLEGYESLIWSDTVADNAGEIEKHLRAFWGATESAVPAPITVPENSEGNIAGVRFRIAGQGPPIVFLPLSLSPSQWSPLDNQLSKDHTIVTLGGEHLGAIALLEDRARFGYGDMIGELIHLADCSSQASVLEVGCGSGALTRRLAAAVDQATITATDVNAYLLGEATELSKSDTEDCTINFGVVDAERLPFDDDSFDLCVSCTVMEEGDAALMVRELARVTRPGGRVITVVRAVDLDWWVHLPLTADTRRAIGELGPKAGAGVGSRGCADAGLYGLLATNGLKSIQFGPRYAYYTSGGRLEDVVQRIGAVLADEERTSYDNAVRAARQAQSICIGEPFHCAVSVKSDGPSSRQP